MQADLRFQKQPKSFWANVRSISEVLGYTEKGQDRIKVYSIHDMLSAMRKLSLNSQHLEVSGEPTQLGILLHEYFSYRAAILNHNVKRQLMDSEEAKVIFDDLNKKQTPSLKIIMNKQKEDKRQPAYLTNIVNMLIKENLNGFTCVYDPQKLTTIIKDNSPLRTFSRRVDGCFPSHINPIAIWEIKEYYYTTSFGSRISDGIFETILDGLELEELEEHEGIKVQHLLVIDGHYTWWNTGKSHLCRIIDMLNMGYVDEVLFGSEVVERLPQIVQSWVKTARERGY